LERSDYPGFASRKIISPSPRQTRRGSIYGAATDGTNRLRYRPMPEEQPVMIAVFMRGEDGGIVRTFNGESAFIGVPPGLENGFGWPCLFAVKKYFFIASAPGSLLASGGSRLRGRPPRYLPRATESCPTIGPRLLAPLCPGGWIPRAICHNKFFDRRHPVCFAQ